jgi:hypothetical protein
MTVTDSAYIAVLENKLAQAERNLYEFRQIFTHWQGQREEPAATATLAADDKGRYPGQLPPPQSDEEERDVPDLAEHEEACLE